MSARGYSLEKRGKNTWRVEVGLGYRNPDGTPARHRETIKAKTKTEASRKAEVIRDHVTSGNSNNFSNDTVEEYLRKYLDNVEAAGTIKELTLYEYKKKMGSYVYPRIGSIKLQQLTVEDMDKFYTGLLQNGKLGQLKKSGKRSGGQGLSPSTIRQIHNILHKAFERAVAYSIIPINPTRATTKPRRVKVTKAILSKDNLQQLEAAIEKMDDRAFATALTVGQFTGMRRGEVLGLQWGDISFKTDKRPGTIKIARALRTKQGGGVKYDTPKSEKGIRTIAMPTKLNDCLKEHKRQQAALLADLGAAQTDATEVILKDCGSVMTPDNLSKKTSKLFKKLNFPEKTSFHTFRHTLPSYLANKGVPQIVTMQILGHSSSQLTADVYTHVVDGAQEEAARIIEEAYSTNDESETT